MMFRQRHFDGLSTERSADAALQLESWAFFDNCDPLYRFTKGNTLFLGISYGVLPLMVYKVNDLNV